MPLRKYLRRAIFAILSRRRSETTLNGVQLKMVRRFTGDERISAFDLPPKYRLREYQPGDEDAWIRFINETGTFGVWNRVRLLEDIVQLLVPGGGLFVVGEQGIVGCASACHVKEYVPHATLMYVAVDRKNQGCGLGKAMTCAAMKVSQQAGYSGMVLNTDDFRIPAIRTYLAVGFEPYLVSELNHSGRWEAVLGTLESTSSHATDDNCIATGEQA